MSPSTEDPSKLSHIAELCATVIGGGYCVGCGACTAFPDSPLRIVLNNEGRYEAVLGPGEQAEKSLAPVLSVCPFSTCAVDEDEIGHDLFGPDAERDDRFGYYLATYAGFVSQEPFRRNGSSGGMGRWIASELLRLRLVDAVVHVERHVPSPENPVLFRYVVASCPERVMGGAKSAYYPVEMSQVLSHILNHPGRYAIAGVPCFIKAVRLLARQNRDIANCVAFCIGLVCGHLKSTRYADMLAWQLGIPPGQLLSIDFRKKFPGARANQKGLEMVGGDGREAIHAGGIVQDFFGTNYGYGFFKYRACDFCDDVFAETADVSIGDAWLPQYIKDGEGTNVVIVRHPEIAGIVRSAIAAGNLRLDALSAEEVARSQDAGLRHRRSGLAYRLELADRAGRWRPPKRVAPGSRHLSNRLKRIHRYRVTLAEESHRSFAQALDRGDFGSFKETMKSLLRGYTRLCEGPLWRRALRKLRSTVQQLWSFAGGERCSSPNGCPKTEQRTPR